MNIFTESVKILINKTPYNKTYPTPRKRNKGKYDDSLKDIINTREAKNV